MIKKKLLIALFICATILCTSIGVSAQSTQVIDKCEKCQLYYPFIGWVDDIPYQTYTKTLYYTNGFQLVRVESYVHEFNIVERRRFVGVVYIYQTW